MITMPQPAPSAEPETESRTAPVSIALVRWPDPAAVAEALRTTRRVASAAVFPVPGAGGWVAAATDDPDAATAAADLSAQLDSVVFWLSAGRAELRVFSRGKRLFKSGADPAGDGDTDRLAGFIAPERPLADLRGRPAAGLAEMLSLPNATPPADGPGAADSSVIRIDCVKRRWWEWWG
jgi:hypothetical protein